VYLFFPAGVGPYRAYGMEPRRLAISPNVKVATGGGKTTYNSTFFAYTGLKTGMVAYGECRL
jgi:hypothetical protein